MTAPSTAGSGAAGWTLPVYSNLPLSQGSAAVTTAIVVVHAGSGDAPISFRQITDAASAAGLASQTLVVAPHFQTPAGVSCGELYDEPEGTDLVWPCDSWKDGAQATNPGGSEGVPTSYDVMDQILAMVNNPALFPNLQRLVVAGHAAGGQFALRYSAVTQSPDAARAHFRSFNPGTYLYLDAIRPGSDASCSMAGCAGTFDAPPSNATSCADFDNWPYGTQAPWGAAAALSGDQMRTTLLSRDLQLFVGDQDVLAHSAGTGLDHSCGANDQGADRLSRAINWWNHITASTPAQIPLTVIGGCADDGDCLYASTAAAEALFGSKL